jgi:hypothetical protein
VIGTYMAPLGFSFSGFFQYLRGNPLYRTYTVTLGADFGTTVFADPWTTWSEENFSRLDLRAEKVFNFGSRGMELGLMVDVFNVFNENNVILSNGLTGTLGADGSFVTNAGPFQRPRTVQPPRSARLGVRLRF